MLFSEMDPWKLAAVEQLTYSGKSLILALAIVHGRIGLQEGISAARLEEIFQAEEWGEVEAGHDLDMADIGSRVSAPIVLIKLLKW